MLSKISNSIDYCEGKDQGTVGVSIEDVTWLGVREKENFSPRK